MFEFEIEDDPDIISDEEFHARFDQFFEDMAKILSEEDADFIT